MIVDLINFDSAFNLLGNEDQRNGILEECHKNCNYRYTHREKAIKMLKVIIDFNIFQNIKKDTELNQKVYS